MALKGARGTVSIIDKATKPLRSIAEAFGKLGKSSKKANTDLSKTQQAINGISKAQNRLNRTQAHVKRQTRDIGSQAVGIAALGLAFREILRPAIKFEQAMKDLEAVAFGSADATVPVAKNMELLSAQAKKLGSTTRFSAIQAAEGQMFLARAGFKTNQILSAMPAVLDLTAATGDELGETSDRLSDLLGAFGKKAKDSAALADLLAASTSGANVDMENLFETLKIAAPIGIAAGQSMEGITTATALLGNVGIKGSMAGTALKNAFIRFAAPASEGKKVLKELGIATSDASGNMLPMQQVLLNLGKSAKKLSQSKRIQAFDAVFGKIAMAGAINLEKAVTSGDFEKMLKNLKNSEGVAKKMAKIRMDSTEGSIVQLMSAVEGLAISFGTILTPIIRGLATVMTALTAPMQSFIQNNETLIRAVGIFAGVMIAGKIATLAYTATMWLVSPAITAMNIALKAAKLAMIALNFVMKRNPVALVITAIVVAVGGLITFGDTLKKVWSAVFDGVAKVWEYIKSTNMFKAIAKIGEFMGIGDTDVNVNKTANIIPPAQATQAIQANSSNNTSVVNNIAIEDGRIKSIETSGATTSDTFLNDGKQF